MTLIGASNPPKPQRNRSQLPGKLYLLRTLASLLILLGSGLLLSAFVVPHDLSQQSEAASQVSLESDHKAVAPQPDVFRPIEQVQLGDRVAGKNPLREQVWHVTPEPESWRKVSLKMRKPSDKLLQIELLRPLDWIENSGAVVGQSIQLDMAELGAVGDAEVTAIAACPQIKPGNGTIVTGKFTHEVDQQTQVLNLRLEGESTATGVTDNHPYWSETRQAFIPAGQLAVGEKVNTNAGIREIASIEPRGYLGHVHNLETLEHVYRVGGTGALVHNTCNSIRLGYGDHLEEFGTELRATGFDTVQFGERRFYQIAENGGGELSGQWTYVHEAINNSDRIAFNLKGLTTDRFQAFLQRGYKIGSEPALHNWTNAELFTILSDLDLMKKTQFFNGDIDEFIRLMR